MTDPSEARSGGPETVRVVLLTNFIPPYRLPLYEALARRVGTLTVLVSTPVEGNRSWRPSVGELAVRVQRTLTIPRSWRHPAGFSDTTYIHVPLDTFAQLRRLDPDVVVSAELGFRSLFSALYCMRRQRVRLVLWATLSERTERGRGRLRLLLRRWLLRRADRVIVNGAGGERYVARFGVPPERVVRIPYVASPGFREAADSAPVSSALRNLLFVGQLTERKGLLPFLQALAVWSRSNPMREMTFTIAGGGPQLQELQRARGAGSVELRVVGEQEPDALPALFAAADALRLPHARGRVGRRRQRGTRGGLARPRQRAQPGGRGAMCRGRDRVDLRSRGPGLDARCDRPRVCDAGGAASADERQRAGTRG